MLTELVETEKTYVEALKTAIEFLNCFQQQSHEKRSPFHHSTPTINDDDIKTIFNSIELILQLQQMFFDKLQIEFNKFPQPVLIGKLFKEMAAFLKV